MLDEVTWLYRGVPRESPEVADVFDCGEIRPPRPERIGAYWRAVHVAGQTETGYLSWTTNRDIAVAAAQDASNNFDLSGQIVVFRVPAASFVEDRIFPGREDEDEYLIEGTVDGISISEEEEEDNV